MKYRIQSAAYLKTVRRLTNQVKTLRNLSRIPRPLPRPGSEAYSLGNALSAKDAQARQEAYYNADRGRVDKDTIAFFAQPYTGNNTEVS